MKAYEIKPGAPDCGCGGACGDTSQSPPWASAARDVSVGLPFKGGAPNLFGLVDPLVTDRGGSFGVSPSIDFDVAWKSLYPHLDRVSVELLSMLRSDARFNRYTSDDVLNGNPLLLLDLYRVHPEILGKIEVVASRSGPADPAGMDECSFLLRQRGTLEQALRDLGPYAEQTERERQECREDLMRGNRSPARLCNFLGAQYTTACNQAPNSAGCRSAYTTWQDCLGQRLSADQIASGCDGITPSEPGPGQGAVGAIAATLSEMIRRSIREIDGLLIACRQNIGGSGIGPAADNCRFPEQYRDCRRRGQTVMFALLFIAGILAYLERGPAAAFFLTAAVSFTALYEYDCHARFCVGRGR